MILPTCFPMIPLQTLWLNQHHQTFRQHVENFGWARCLFLPGNGGVQYNLIHWKGWWELNRTKINKEEPASTRPWSTTSTPVTQNYNWPKLVLIWISLDVILFCYMISGITFIYIFLIDVLLKAYLKKSQVNIEDRLIDYGGMKFCAGNFQILGADS